MMLSATFSPADSLLQLGVGLPYAPTASFRMFHNGEYLFVRYDVAEDCTAARVAEDNGEVWTDSCVEFFISTDDKGYYNFETNCIGKLLLGFRCKDKEPAMAPKSVLIP